MNFAAILMLVMRLIPLAEAAFSSKPKSGADKKALVMNTTKTAIDVMQSVSTGGQKNTWDNLEAPLSTIIDNAATILFKTEQESTNIENMRPSD